MCYFTFYIQFLKLFFYLKKFQKKNYIPIFLQAYFPKILLNHFISLFEVLERTVVVPDFPLQLLFLQLNPHVQKDLLVVFFADTGTSSSFRCDVGFPQQALGHWICKNNGFSRDAASGQRRLGAFKEGPRAKETPGNYTLTTYASTSHTHFSCLDIMVSFGLWSSSAFLVSFSRSTTQA